MCAQVVCVCLCVFVCVCVRVHLSICLSLCLSLRVIPVIFASLKLPTIDLATWALPPPPTMRQALNILVPDIQCTYTQACACACMHRCG